MDEAQGFFLEDLNIEGFKSFSELTNMTFQPGIGVIMGNNGEKGVRITNEIGEKAVIVGNEARE